MIIKVIKMNLNQKNIEELSIREKNGVYRKYSK